MGLIYASLCQFAGGPCHPFPICIRWSHPWAARSQLRPITNLGCQLCILAITRSHHHVIYRVLTTDQMTIVWWGCSNHLDDLMQTMGELQMFWSYISYAFITWFVQDKWPNGSGDINTLRLRGNEQRTTFSNAFSSMKMFEFRLKFHWSLFLRFQLTIFHHRFR